VKSKVREAEQHRQLDEKKERAHDYEGEQELCPGHGRGDHPLEQLLHADLHQHIADAPHAGGHEVHADEPGNEEVDVARARLGDGFVYRRRRPARVQCQLGESAGEAAFRTG